jgi:hypothetical protein
VDPIQVDKSLISSLPPPSSSPFTPHIAPPRRFPPVPISLKPSLCHRRGWSDPAAAQGTPSPQHPPRGIAC